MGWSQPGQRARLAPARSPVRRRRGLVGAGRGRSCLSATGRCSCSSKASYTTPMPPVPSTPRIRNRPTRSPGCGGRGALSPAPRSRPRSRARGCWGRVPPPTPAAGSGRSRPGGARRRPLAGRQGAGHERGGAGGVEANHGRRGLVFLCVFSLGSGTFLAHSIATLMPAWEDFRAALPPALQAEARRPRDDLPALCAPPGGQRPGRPPEPWRWSEGRFLAHLAARLPPDRPLKEALAAVRTDDLYLAAACAQGLPAALVAFDRTCLAPLAGRAGAAGAARGRRRRPGPAGADPAAGAGCEGPPPRRRLRRRRQPAPLGAHGGGAAGAERRAGASRRWPPTIASWPTGCTTTATASCRSSRPATGRPSRRPCARAWPRWRPPIRTCCASATSTG